MLIGIGSAGWAVYLQATGNFHAIANNVAYRANTLGVSQLREVIADEGIRTIVNLRGSHPEEAWYRDEVAQAQAAGVTLVDIKMSDSSRPDDDTIRRLRDVLRDAPRPILIHCKAGADRTGLAAALFEYQELGKSPEEASRQLSFRYGHFPWWPSASGAMDETFWSIVENPRP